MKVVRYFFLSIAALGCSGNISTVGAVSSAPESAFERPELENPGLLRKAGLIFTVRRTGEFSRPIQVTVYGDEESVYAVLYFATDERRQNWDPNLERITLKSDSCSKLVDVLDFLRGLKRPSHMLSGNFYAPSVNYQVWATSLNESRHYSFSAADHSAESVATWADGGHPSAEYLQTLDRHLEDLLACVPQEP